MFTGLCLGQRFYVGANDAAEAEASVRKAYELRWSKEKADSLPIEQIEPWGHVVWANPR